ncbi:MAG: hypothetical protein LBU42_02840, partial [Prevotellaceae bacterium]|nr:hypothetical protein [Prevotellaceae bacterium]
MTPYAVQGTKNTCAFRAEQCPCIAESLCAARKAGSAILPQAAFRCATLAWGYENSRPPGFGGQRRTVNGVGAKNF